MNASDFTDLPAKFRLRSGDIAVVFACLDNPLDDDKTIIGYYTDVDGKQESIQWTAEGTFFNVGRSLFDIIERLPNEAPHGYAELLRESNARIQRMVADMIVKPEDC